jgi:hypothetical protein
MGIKRGDIVKVVAPVVLGNTLLHRKFKVISTNIDKYKDRRVFFKDPESGHNYDYYESDVVLVKGKEGE